MKRAVVRPWTGLVLAILVAGLPGSTLAAPLTTTHYRLDPDVTSNFGGKGSSTSYGLVDAGGEAALGFGTSNSYRLGAGYVAELQKAIQIAVLPSGISAYYALDTGVGVQAYDTSVAGNTGVMQGGTSWTTGQISGGLTLNGTTGYVSTATSSTNPNPFTLEGWFKTTSTTGGQIIGFGDSQTGSSTNVDRAVYMTNAGNLIFGINPGTRKTVASAGTYRDGAWHHVAATVGSGGMALYVDGVSVGTDATGTTAANVTGWWRLGYNNLSGWTSAPTSNFFAGSLDEVKIYNRALNATEILNEYNAGVAGIVSAQTIPTQTAGTSQTSLTDVTVRTDGAGYNLAINQDHDLRHTDNTTTIAAIGAAIANPALWTEGTTKGLGFTLTAGQQLEAKYGTSPNYKYAALPGSATTYHTRTGYTAGAAEATTMQFRLDTNPAQKSGKYSNTVTVSATIIP